MADYTVSTNLLSWLLVQRGLFGWPQDGAVAQKIANMLPGDLIVPKFAQSASYGSESHASYQRRAADAFGVDYEVAQHTYEKTVRGGEAAVPFVLRVVDEARVLSGDAVPNPSIWWTCVEVERVELAHPISTSEFLRLRAIPVSVSIQFKATVAKGRHVQELPLGAGDAVIAAGSVEHRGPVELRSETLVCASTVEEAQDALGAAGFAPRVLDRAFVFNEQRILGLCECTVDGTLVHVGDAIERPPASLRMLFESVADRPGFKPQRALHAARQLEEMLQTGDTVEVVGELGHFHDRYFLLPSKVNVALELAATPVPPVLSGAVVAAGAEGDDEASAEELTIEQVEGLSVHAVRSKLPPGVSIEDAVLAETVTALRAGKHLIFSGPPGTGKSTLAGAVCEAVGAAYRTATATADWSTVDTIGAYLPGLSGGLAFEEGIVLAALSEGKWLIIDELNRADIDKAFGPLFTLLAGAGGAGAQTVSLPYRDAEGQRIEVGWAPTQAQVTTPYAVTGSWRLIGTMNDRDKSSLFGLSFAFLRRFAVVDVGLPDAGTYGALLKARLPSGGEHEPEALVNASLAVAHGPIPLGPAIMLDVAEFTRRGVTTTASGSAPYANVQAAFITALRLYAVPQYEGAELAKVKGLLDAVKGVFVDPPKDAWTRFDAALRRAAIGG